MFLFRFCRADFYDTTVTMVSSELQFSKNKQGLTCNSSVSDEKDEQFLKETKAALIIQNYFMQKITRRVNLYTRILERLNGMDRV